MTDQEKPINTAPDSKQGYIKLTSKADNKVLSGLLGLNITAIYQCRKDGRLPEDSELDYFDCIKHYVNYYVKKSHGTSADLLEAKLKEEIKNLSTKQEIALLDIAERKKELVNVSCLEETFFPVFKVIADGLINIKREYPDTSKHISNLLKALSSLGEHLSESSEKLLQEYADNKMKIMDEELNKLSMSKKEE